MPESLSATQQIAREIMRAADALVPLGSHDDIRHVERVRTLNRIAADLWPDWYERTPPAA